MKKNTLFNGALALAVGGILAKILSAVYRILLTRILGGEGIGLYQLIFPVYSLCVVLSTAGLPMAISKVVARSEGNEKTVVKKSMVLTAIVSILIFTCLIVFSGGLATLQGDKNLKICYIILAPTIILVGGISVLKGYFQGKNNFMPSAVSGIVEQFVKLFVGLILSLAFIKYGVLQAVIGAVVAIILSEVASFVVLLVYLSKHPPQNLGGNVVLVKNMIKDILPITLTNIVLPLATFIDSLLVVNLLSINFSKQTSVFLFGLESGAVSSLVSLPTIFSFAIASVILPAMSTRVHKFNKNQNLTLAVKIVLMICVPCVVLFLITPERLLVLLYGNKLNGFGIDGINVARRLLAISGLGLLFLAVNQLLSSCLNAIELRFVTVRNLCLAVVVKFVLEILFLPSKMLNIYALAASNTICYALVAVLNWFEIRKCLSININFSFWRGLILSNSFMVLTLLAVMSFGGGVANSLLAFVVSAITYLVCLWLFKILEKKDMATFRYKIN